MKTNKHKTKKTSRWQKKQVFCISADVYRVDVVVAVDSKEKDVYEWAKKNAKKHASEIAARIKGWDDDSCEGRMYPGNGFIVFINSNESWIKTFGTLVHEMTHVVHYLLRDRRIPLIEDTEEAYTYLIEHLMTEAAREML